MSSTAGGECSTLEQLKGLTVVVADSGDIESARKYQPQDATTNPSLLLTAAKLPAYAGLVKDALQYACAKGGDASLALDKLIVNFGVEYLKIIPGRVSTEVDARLSYDTEGTINKARQLIALYGDMGIPKERILIKIASTWEGIMAAHVLEAEGIHCNMTLLFSLTQAAACAEVGATLISPFVGRILDWHRKRSGRERYEPAEDPGVLSVRQIYQYLKKFDYKTIVMGASFRNVEEIIELAGIDYLTIAPKLLEELAAMRKPLEAKLTVDEAKRESHLNRLSYSGKEALFKEHLKADEMASELLADGIRRFDEDAKSLEAYLASQL